MKVFIHWSGERSREAANLLRDWLPEIVPTIEPWLAADVLGRDNDWLRAVAGKATLVIPCITADSLSADWRSVASLESDEHGSPLVIPWMIGLPLSNLPSAFGIIPAYGSSDSEMLRIVNMLNDIAERSEDRQVIEQRFTLNWPRFERAILNVVNAQLHASADLIVTAAIEASGVVTSGSEDPNRAADVVALMESVAEIKGLLKQVIDERLVSERNFITVAPSTPSADGPKRLFIGSSAEGKDEADTVQLLFEHYDVEAVVWSQGLFKPSMSTIDSLAQAARNDMFDFAVIVMTGDDILIKRGVKHRVPRDNLLFELGLFAGALGISRTFVIHPRRQSLGFPSDLNGFTMLEYSANRTDGNLEAALGPACLRIRNAMGVRTS